MKARTVQRIEIEKAEVKLLVEKLVRKLAKLLKVKRSQLVELLHAVKKSFALGYGTLTLYIEPTYVKVTPALRLTGVSMEKTLFVAYVFRSGKVKVKVRRYAASILLLKKLLHLI